MAWERLSSVFASPPADRVSTSVFSKSPSIPASRFTLPPHLQPPKKYVLIGAASLGALILLGTVSSSFRSTKPKVIPSPKEAVLQRLSAEELTKLPYPLDALPGARDIDSPWGSIRVYEWGPEDGEKILLIHGISTPSIALADLAHKLVGRGCRVMLFDLFGRGFSAAPSPEHHPYDSSLYTTQLLLCLSSSPISWSQARPFTIIGYSLGGAIAADFTSYFPNLIRGLVLVAPGGLIRTTHISLKSKLLYQSGGWIPEWLVKTMVTRRLWTGPESARTIEPEPEGIENAETTTTIRAGHEDARSIRSERSTASGTRRRKHKKRESERDGSPESRVRSHSIAASDLEPGDAQDDGKRGNAVYLSSHHALLAGYPQSTASAVVDWQIQHHKGFVPAFISSIRNAPVHDQHHRWAIIKQNIEDRNGPLKEVWLVLGETDPIIVKEELVEDATGVLGDDNVRVRVVEGAGHEIAIERADEIVQVVGSVFGWHKKPHSVRSTHKRRGFF